MSTITNYAFPKAHINVKKQLITDLGKLEDKRVLPFLVELYPAVEDTAMYQVAILKAVANQKTKKAYESFIELLEYDIPLSSSKWGIPSIFYPMYDTLPLANNIFPKILNYSFVEDYRLPTYRLLSHLIVKNQIKSKSYKKKYKQILREAKIELKTQISKEQEAQSKKKSDYYYGSYKNKGNDLLVNYAILLMPFYNKSDVQDFFKKLSNVEDYIIRTDIYGLLAKRGIPVDQLIWNELAEDNINRTYLYERLNKIDRLDLFPETYNNQKSIVKSLLYDKGFDFDTDSLIFLRTEEIIVKNDTGLVYFYKSKGEKDDDWKLDYLGLQPTNLSLINTEFDHRKKGVKIEKHKTIDEIIDNEIKAIQLEGHKRAKKRNSGNDFSWLW
jgi:hypothetical protein